ncbi:MAG: T9SS type A sorting domain-containing protein [Phycisphaerae bacterium]|nr:T9SS type A sorting domain-containing protein [Saprospiraceae bacterium]
MAPQAAKHFTVSPNPALGFTNVALEKISGNYAYPLVLTVSDILGKTLRQELVFDKKHKLLQGDIPAGVCILKLEDQKGNFVAGGKVVWILN